MARYRQAGQGPGRVQQGTARHAHGGDRGRSCAGPATKQMACVAVGRATGDRAAAGSPLANTRIPVEPQEHAQAIVVQ